MNGDNVLVKNSNKNIMNLFVSKVTCRTGNVRI